MEVKITATEPQAAFMQLTCKYPLFVAGFGCVHEDTRILTEHGLTRICDIKPLTRVVSWNETDQKFQLSVSGGSFPKGKGKLYRVTTSQGEFVSTEHHRIFSSSCTYESLGRLSVGRMLKTASQSLLQTMLESDQLSSLLDVQHCSKIDADFLSSYASLARLYGQQFLTAEDSDQLTPPSLICARKSSQICDPFAQAHKDDQSEQKHKHSRHDQNGDHACRHHSSSQMMIRALSLVGRVLASSLGRTCDYLRKSLLSALMSTPHRNAWQSSFLVRSCSTSETVISNIEYVGDGVYWDMQVLGTNNYVTECGTIHHNSGKSEAMANQAVIDAMDSPDSLIGLYEPTYDLIRLIMAPRIEEKLSHFGIRYTYNKSENIVYTSSGQIGDFILRTMDNPARIVGYETYRAHCDEIDTLKEDHARDAWNKIVARNRQRPAGATGINRVSAYTTPEGFRFAYDRWVKNGGGDYQMIQASTMSNPYLPDDYVQSLRDTYPSELIEAYLEGRFVNLTSGVVYRAYNRDRCYSNETIQGNEPLYVGMDFNVGNMAATVYVKRGQVWHAVKEFVDLFDTPDMIQAIHDQLPDHKITVYPDSSGKNRKTVGASESDISLLQDAGFYIKAKPSNPAVKDRVNAANAAFEHGLVMVNSDLCPVTASCLEQQAYDKNGQPDKQSGKDHQNDATTYPIAYEMPVVKPITPMNIKLF